MHLVTLFRPLPALAASAATAVMFVVTTSLVGAEEFAPRGACFAFPSDSDRPVALPLESTEIVLDVKPGLLEAEVVQTFSNREEVALEATYLYPLPHDATLLDFELRYRDRVVRSVVREKAEARAVYESAKAEGRKTALLEQKDPSLFSTAVANILPGESVQVVIRFIQPLALTTGSIEVRFPMVTGDKYFPADWEPGAVGEAAPNPARMIPGLMTGNHVYAFDIQVAGLPEPTITSPSHRIRVEPARKVGDQFFVSLEEDITIPDRDFVLRIEVESENLVRPTLSMQRTATGDYGLLTVFPPRQIDGRGRASMRPRDVLFLVDRSSSMSGARIDSARRGLERCIDSLSLQDRFQIVAYDSTFAVYRPGWIAVSSQTLLEAVEHVRSLRAQGGTELQPALAASLAAFESNDREQILILMTDGDVGNTKSLFDIIEREIGRVRLFTFGIGDAPNAALLAKMAELGRGQARFIKDDATIERELADLFATLRAPMLSDVRLTLLDSAGQPIEHAKFPETLPDVFATRPIQAVFRATGGTPTAVLIEGRERDRVVTHRTEVQANPLRGRGLETMFGRRLYSDTAMMLHRAQTPEEQEMIRQEMLETALQFQLVTEFTSRVAVDQAIARDPQASLATRHVAQYRPADQGGAVLGPSPADPGVVVLSAFSVQTDQDAGYLGASTIAGARLRSSLGRVSTVLNVVPREVVQEAAPTNLDDAAMLTWESYHNPLLARAGSDAGLLDGLPIATVIDPATLDRINLQTSGPTWTEIEQDRAAPRSPRTTLTGRIGDEGLVMVSLRAAGDLLGRYDLPVLAVASWTQRDHVRSSLYLDLRKDYGRDAVRTNLQWRDLAGYGSMRLARVSFERALRDSLLLSGTLAWHRLEREDPLQFRIASPTNRYDGLGFLNLGLLTAETRELEDVVAQVHLSGRMRDHAERVHTWQSRVRGQTHRSDWVTPFAGDAVAPRRHVLGLDAVYRLDFPEDQMSLDAQVGWSSHETTGETIRRRRTQNAAIGINRRIGQHWAVFGNWSHEETLPWSSTGRWLVTGAERRAIASEVETRRGTQVGIRFGRASPRIEGFVSVFREDVEGQTYRDWAAEAARFGGTFASGPDGHVYSPVMTSVWNEHHREGWISGIEFNPSRAFALRASWSGEWTNHGPFRGGNRHALLGGRYEFRQGLLRGASAGLNVAYRNDLTFNDGYVLSGGFRWDLVFGYQISRDRKRSTQLQLNLMNGGDRAWQPTRFAEDRGRQLILSVTHDW